jgi:hypothetical protein
VSGFGEVPLERPIFSVRLIVRELPPLHQPVLSGWGESYAILGRDELNNYRATLDGPNLRTEISG